jgi:hypothetical protein
MDLPRLLNAIALASGPSRLLDGQIMFGLFAHPVGHHGYIWPEDNPSWSFALVFDAPVPDKTKDQAVRDARASGERAKEWIEWPRDDGRWILMNELRVPPLTASLDAGAALLQRVLPGWTASGVLVGEPAKIAVTRPSLLRPMPVVAKGATPPLALLAAILTAAHAHRRATTVVD